MSRANKGLLTGEEIVYTTKLHWKSLILPIVLVLVATLPSLYGYFALEFKAKAIFLFVALVPLVILLIAVIKRNASEFAVTNMRVAIYLGVMSSQSFEIMLNKIESITVDQDLMGKMLNYGSVVVGGTGGTKEKFTNIQSPFQLRKKIEEQMGKIRS